MPTGYGPMTVACSSSPVMTTDWSRRASLSASLRLTIDFAPEIGMKRSSAQLTVHYAPEHLVGRQIVAAVNIGTRRIAGFTSEVLVLGAMPSAAEVVLLSLERPVANGTRIG